MANAQRGEISAVFEGEVRVLCLTLGALAELEARLQAGDLVGLSERFSSGRVSARDLTGIIGAGLRGGGNAVTDDDLARMSIEGGLKGAAEIAARLLRVSHSSRMQRRRPRRGHRFRRRRPGAAARRVRQWGDG